MKPPSWKRMFPSCLMQAKLSAQITIVLAATFLLFAVSSAQAQANRTPTPQNITINRDMGGSVYEYAWTVAKAAHNGSQVQIRGTCVSACTLYLAMPKDQVCVTAGARFSFHLPYGASRTANNRAADYMMRKYPQWVRNWIASKGGLSNRMIHMSSTYASQFIATCPSASSPAYASAEPRPQVPTAPRASTGANTVVARSAYNNTSPVFANVTQKRAAKPRSRPAADR